MATDLSLQFKAMFPEFVDVNVTVVQAQITAAQMWVDPAIWNATDYPLGVLYFAAHLLTLMLTQQAANAVGGTGTTDLFLRSISFGERHVQFGERRQSKVSDSGSGPGEELLSQTIYGSMFLMLRNRNIAAVVVV